MVIFTSRFNRLVNIANARSVVATVGLKGYDKRTGKLIVDKDMGQQSQPFHGFVVDVRQGRLDLMDYQNKISFLWGPGLALAEGAKSASLPAVASGSPSSMGNDPANNPGLPAMIFGINGPGQMVRPANANRPAVPKPNGPGRAFPAPNMPLVPPTQTVPAAPKP